MTATSNGTFTVAGSGTPMSANNAKTLFARYRADGAVDTTFGQQGLVYLDPLPMPFSFASAIVAQSDAKVVAMGLGLDLQGEQKNDVYLVRLEADGSYDGEFGTGGVARLHLDTRTFAAGIALQSDGRIVVAGGYGHIANTSTMFVVRYWP